MEFRIDTNVRSLSTSPNQESQDISSLTLANRATSFATALRSGDLLLLDLDSGAEMLAAMLGCWQAGSAFCVLPPRTRGTRRAAIREQLATCTVIDAEWLHAKPGGNHLEMLEVARNDDDLALVQFTSGSTSAPKPIPIRFGELRANFEALIDRVGVGSKDRMVSWAPWYHDMGLMSALLSLFAGTALTVIPTERFMRRPTLWLTQLSVDRGTLSVAPPFALRLLAQRRAAGIDLSAWRYCWVGGEQVFAEPIRAFEQAFVGAGLRQGVLQPTYGLAEAVVAVACPVPGTPIRTHGGVVSCGPPLENLRMDMARSGAAPERIRLSGPSVCKELLKNFDTHADGVLDTGDLGFLMNGELYVAGREREMIKRGGESFPPAVVEEIAADTLGLAAGRALAFSGPARGGTREEVVLLVETRTLAAETAAEIGARVRAALGLQIDRVERVRPGALPRTSSGKLQRGEARQLYRRGELGVRDGTIHQ